MIPPAKKNSLTMRLRWVLDANIVYEAAKENPTALILLFEIQLQDGLGLDKQWAIDKEYRPALEENPTVSHWFYRMYNEGRCKRYASDLPEDCEKRFRQIKFHNDDWKYVGVVMRTEDRLLVTEDLREHHFSSKTCDYLKNTYGIRVLCLAEARKKAQSGI